MNTLPTAVVWIGDLAAQPLAGAEEVAAVDLGDVLDARARGTARLIVSPLGWASASSEGRARSTTLRSSMLRSATRRIAGAGAQAPALAVLLDQPLALER